MLATETETEKETEKVLAREEQQRQTLEDIRQLVVRARNGQMVYDEEHGPELARRFLLLDETDQERFWDNVREWSEYENWIANGPGEAPWKRDEKPRRPPIMAPVLPPADGLTLEKALNRLGRVRARANEWRAFCPAHDTHHFSLVVSESKFREGEPVFFCYAGCTHQAVKDALLRRDV